MGFNSGFKGLKCKLGWFCQNWYRQLVKRDHLITAASQCWASNRQTLGKHFSVQLGHLLERPPVIPRNLHVWYRIRLLPWCKCRQVVYKQFGTNIGSIFKQSKTAVLDCSNVEDRTDGLFRNVGNYLSGVTYQKNEDLICTWIWSTNVHIQTLSQCFSTAGPWPGPWHQLYRATKGSPGSCHFSFLSIFHE